MRFIGINSTGKEVSGIRTNLSKYTMRFIGINSIGKEVSSIHIVLAKRRKE